MKKHIAVLCSSLLAFAVCSADEKKPAAKSKSFDEQYVLGPDSQEKPDVPKGKIIELKMEDSKTYPGFQHKWWIYVPAQYDESKPAALMVFQDGGGYVKRDGSWRVPVVFDNLIAKKEMPVTVGVFIDPGVNGDKKNRSVEYDTMSDVYSKFLLDDILPEVRKHAKITDNPDGRAISGLSSGGICAFTVAWERPDQFRKVFSAIGSFTDIRGGGKYPDLVRASEKKSIRVFQQDGANDIVNQFGSWPEANKKMAAALDEKGYDHKFVFGEGTHNPRHGAMLLPDVLRWLWRDYKP